MQFPFLPQINLNSLILTQVHLWSLMGPSIKCARLYHEVPLRFVARSKVANMYGKRKKQTHTARNEPGHHLRRISHCCRHGCAARPGMGRGTGAGESKDTRTVKRGSLEDALSCVDGLGWNMTVHEPMHLKIHKGQMIILLTESPITTYRKSIKGTKKKLESG